MYTLPKETAITSEVVKKAIAYNYESKKGYDDLHNYYLGQHDILNRIKPTTLSNNKIVINHAKYITDLNIGYLLGNPVEYQVKEGGLNLDPILKEYKKQNISDTDHEIGKNCSIFGKSFEYIYALEDNSVKSTVLDPRNCIVVYDNTVEHNALFAVIYDGSKGKTKVSSIKVIDKKSIYTFSDDYVKTATESHFFGDVSVIEYVNNPECIGDFYHVRTLINAYNLLQSDRVNDKQQLVEAILVISGTTLTDAQVVRLKDDRIMSGLDLKAKVEYLVKATNEADTDVLRKVLEQDIFKISMTPNMSDENFAGTASGVALNYKLLPFEINTQNKERYFERGLKIRLALYSAYLKVNSKGVEIPIHEVDVVFKRNLPRNDYETSQTINNLKGLVDDETLISQISFVKDAKVSLELARTEAVDRAAEMAAEFGTDNPTKPPIGKKPPVKTKK